MNEITLTANIRKMLKREFPKMYVQRVSDKFLSGLPDLRLISGGLSGDIEVKFGSGRVKPIQRKILDYISQAGGVWCVVYSIEGARLFAHELERDGQRYQAWRELQ